MSVTKLDQNRCQLCVKHKPAWWCIDHADTAWVKVFESGPELQYDAGAMYPVCQRCRDQMERDMKRGRKVEWIEWSDHVEA